MPWANLPPHSKALMTRNAAAKAIVAPIKRSEWRLLPRCSAPMDMAIVRLLVSRNSVLIVPIGMFSVPDPSRNCQGFSCR